MSVSMTYSIPEQKVDVWKEIGTCWVRRKGHISRRNGQSKRMSGIDKRVRRVR